MLALNKKRICNILIFCCVILNVLAINSFAVVSKTNEFYVNDYANLITESTEQYIINTNLNLYEQTGAQVVVVTVQNLEGKAIEEYATELFRKFEIGTKSKDNGVLMLLALEEREFRIEVGYGLEGALPDSKTGRIQDNYIIPYFTQNNWDDGIKNGYSAIIEIIAKEYGVAIDAQESMLMNDVSLTTSNTEDYAPIIIMVVFVLLFFIAIKNSKTNNYRGYHRNYDYLRNMGSHIDRDLFNGTTKLGRSSDGYSSSKGRSYRKSSSKGVRNSFGGGGSSGGGGSTRKF